MLITVFTPAYNRANLLPRIYDSLCRQSFRCFEWLIVDDGSVDDTENVVNGFIQKPNDFAIHYIKKANGGKHTAINMGVQAAKGELFFIVDSDDSLPDKSLELISSAYDLCKDDEALGGVCGYMAHHNGEMIGRFVKAETLKTNTCELQYKYHVVWDMAEIYKTAVLKEFPFPEFDGERFCPEDLVLFRISKKYKLLLFPEVVYFRDYLDGGLTDNIIRIRMKSPLASTLFYSELNKETIPLLAKIRSAINFYRFKFCLPKDEETARISNSWIWVMPLAYIMHLNDTRKCR